MNVFFHSFFCFLSNLNRVKMSFHWMHIFFVDWVCYSVDIGMIQDKLARVFILNMSSSKCLSKWLKEKFFLRQVICLSLNDMEEYLVPITCSCFITIMKNDFVPQHSIVWTSLKFWSIALVLIGMDGHYSVLVVLYLVHEKYERNGRKNFKKMRKAWCKGI